MKTRARSQLTFGIFLLLAGPALLRGQPCDNYTNGGSLGGNGIDPVTTVHCYENTPTAPLIPSNPSGGSGGGPVYQWEVSVEGGPWQVVTGAAGNNGFAYFQHAAELAGLGFLPSLTASFRRGARRPACADWVYTNERQFVIIHEVDPGALQAVYTSCTTYGNNGCATGNALTTIPPAGGDAPYEFQWQMSTDAASWSFYSSEENPLICPPAGTRRYFRRGVRPLGSNCAFRYTNTCTYYLFINDFQIQIATVNPSCSNTQDGQITISDLNGNSPEIFDAIEFALDGGGWLVG